MGELETFGNYSYRDVTMGPWALSSLEKKKLALH